MTRFWDAAIIPLGVALALVAVRLGMWLLGVPVDFDWGLR
jgi:hypothetical protein